MAGALADLLGPERVHHLWLRSLRFLPLNMEPPPGSDVKTKMGLLKSPVGLAAGYDKVGRYVAPLAKLGFGYIVAGTFTLKPREGHPRPRVARRGQELALVNAMGMPNPGVYEFVRSFRRPRRRCAVLASVAGDDIEELAECHRAVQPVVDGVEVNLSCPTFPSAARLRETSFVKELSGRLREIKTKPTYLKVPPPTSEDEEGSILRLCRIWTDAGLDGVTAVNALPVEAPELALGVGGLSGRPLKRLMLKMVAKLRSVLQEDVEIHAVGGIMTGADSAEALSAGATTVQIYTALAYRGASAAVKISREMLSGRLV